MLSGNVDIPVEILIVLIFEVLQENKIIGSSRQAFTRPRIVIIVILINQCSPTIVYLQHRSWEFQNTIVIFIAQVQSTKLESIVAIQIIVWREDIVRTDLTRITQNGVVIIITVITVLVSHLQGVSGREQTGNGI